MNRRPAIAWLAMAVCLAACEAPAPARPAAAPSAQAVAGAAEAALRADDALRVAYAHADDRPLAGLLEGEALAASRRDLAGLASRGMRREEVLDARQIVHEAVHGGEAEIVLQLRVRQRMVVAGGNPPYVNVLRQWWAHLRTTTTGWAVFDAHDLRPDQWWPGPTSGRWSG